MPLPLLPRHMAPPDLSAADTLDVAACMPSTPSSPLPSVTSVGLQQVIIIDDDEVQVLTHQSECVRLLPPDTITVPATAVLVTATTARAAMHGFFSQFSGCNGCAIAQVPVAAADADMLDLRRAVPPQMPRQFLDEEAVHVDGFNGDSSGRSDDSSSGSDSFSSFIDDTSVAENADDIARVADFLSSSLPITAEAVLKQASSPSTVAAGRRRRRTVSSSSSPPPTSLKVTSPRINDE
jgi:hypothetical protein